MNEALEAAYAADQHYAELGGETLGDALSGYQTAYSEGQVDHEAVLRMLFLCWYSYAEPPFMTGLRGDDETAEWFSKLFDEHGGLQSEDAEMLFVVGTLAAYIPDSLDASRDWTTVGREAWRRALKLRPAGFTGEEFVGRGAFGQYFSQLVETQGYQFGEVAIRTEPF